MGLEFELLWLLTENLAISGNYAYLDAEYKDFTGVTPTPAGIPLDFSGNVMRQAPEHTGGIDATLTLPLEFGGTVKARIGARYVDKIFYDPGALPAINRENSGIRGLYTYGRSRCLYIRKWFTGNLPVGSKISLTKSTQPMYLHWVAELAVFHASAIHAGMASP